MTRQQLFVLEPAQAEEFARLKGAAERGDGAAACGLGDRYREGQVAPLRPRKAFRWYVRGALAGNADAMNNLGACYHNGFGCQKDMARAIYWYRRGILSGSVEASYNFGRCFKQGNGVPKDWYRAADCLRHAAEKGHPKALEQLAEMGLKLEPEERAGYDYAIEPTDCDDW